MESLRNERPTVESDIVGTVIATVSQNIAADRSDEPDSGTDEKPAKKQKRDPGSNDATGSSSKREFSILEGFSVKMRNVASKIDGFGSKVAAFCGFSTLKTESAPENKPTTDNDIAGATAPREMNPSDETEPMNHADYQDEAKQSVAPESNEAMDASKNGENRFKVIRKLQDQTWDKSQVAILGVKNCTDLGIVRVRRNIVWDRDQQRHLALYVHRDPSKYITDIDNYQRVSENGSWCDSVDERGGPLRIIVELWKWEENSVSRLTIEDAQYRLMDLDLQLKDADGDLLRLEHVVAEKSHDEKFENLEYLSQPFALTEDGRSKVIRTLFFDHTSTGLQLEVDLSPLLNQIGKNAKDFLWYESEDPEYLCYNDSDDADDQDNVKQTTKIEKREPKSNEDSASSSKDDMRFGVCVEMTEMDWFDIPVYIFGMYRRTGTAIMNIRQNIVWQEDRCRQLMLVVDGPAAKYITDEDDYYRRACRADNSSTSSTSSGSFSVDELGGTLIIRVIVLAEDIEYNMVPDTDYNLKHLDVHMKDVDGNLLSSERVTASPTDDVRFKYVFEKHSKPTALTERGGPTVVRTLLFEHPKTKLQLEIDLSPLLNQIRDNAQDYLYYYTTTVDSDDSDSSNSTINSDDSSTTIDSDDFTNSFADFNYDEYADY